MQLRTVFTVNSILAFVFGIGFTFFPTLCISLMGFDIAGDAPLIATGMGVFVIGTSILAFFARNTLKSDARRAIIICLFTLYILLILYKLSLNILFGISFNLMFAAIYVLHIAFVSAYGYFLFGKPREIDTKHEAKS